MAKKIEVELTRSVIGTPRWMRTIVKSLGLGDKMHAKKVHTDGPSVRGQIAKVPHLVSVKEVEV